MIPGRSFAADLVPAVHLHLVPNAPWALAIRWTSGLPYCEKLSKRWRLYGPQTVHHILRASTFLATLAVLMAGQANAAPVLVTGEEAEQYLSVENSASSDRPSAPQPKPKVEAPNSPVDAIQSTAGSSTTGSPVSFASSGGGVSAANLRIAATLQPTQASWYMRISDRLLIPPRFLDGIFRPPKRVDSI